MNSMQLDSKSNQNPSVVDLKSKGPFGAGKTNRSKNSKIQSSNEPLTAGTFNKASFSHHIGQDSTENLPVMIQSDEDSERYSEIEETDQQVEDEIEKVVPEEIADQVFEILQSKGFELYGWGNTSDYN